MPSTADIIAQRLYDAGCRHAFGIPGGHLMLLQLTAQSNTKLLRRNSAH